MCPRSPRAWSAEARCLCAIVRRSFAWRSSRLPRPAPYSHGAATRSAMKQITSNTSKPDAYAEVDAAITALIELAWDRWHPKNPATRGKAPRVVYAAMRDVRAVAHELEALWIHLGN